jgi:ComF family protein
VDGGKEGNEARVTQSAGQGPHSEWPRQLQSLHSAAQAGRKALADFFLPISCVVCERLVPPGEQGIVCGHCWSRVREPAHPRCQRCGHPFGRYGCQWCDYLPPFVRAARSYCWVSPGSGGRIIHALKYSGWRDAAPPMAQRIARLAWPRDVVEERAALIPVPLAASRERERGYNQSELIASWLARRWCIPVWNDALVRVRVTRTQTELTPGERLSNVAGAFRVRNSALAKLRGEHVVLVDDVVTTGATLAACASALFEAGSRIISYVTFGRAAAAGDRLPQ